MAAPTIQTRAIVFSSVAPSSLTAGWTRGDGEFVVVFATAAPSGDLSDAINNGDTFTANVAFGIGSQPFGYPDWYCVYKGFGVSATFTGFTPGATYTFQAFEFNGPDGEEEYLVGPGKDNNPASVTTIMPYQMIRLGRRRSRRG